MGGNLGGLTYGGDFLNYTMPKKQDLRKKNWCHILLKLKSSVLWKTVLREWKDRSRTGRKSAKILSNKGLVWRHI